MAKIRVKIDVVSVVILVVIFLCGPRDAQAVGSLKAETDSAVQLMQQQSFLQALEPLRAAVAAYPYEPSLRPLLVECTFGAALELLHQRNYTGASELLLRGQALAPDEWRFWQFRGHALMLSGDVTGAESELELARIKGEGPVETLKLLARLYYQRGDLELARQCVVEAVEKSPEDTELLSFRAQIEREMLVGAKMRDRSGGNFTVSSDGEINGELGQEVLDVLERAYNETGNLFNLYPNVQIPVILYGRKDFLDITGAPDWSGGLYDGKIRVPVGGLKSMTPELAGVLYHEYAHVLIVLKGGKRVPLWLNEGLAQSAQALIVAPRYELLKGAEIFPLKRLDRSFSDLTPHEVAVAYAQSYAFVSFLGERCGWEQVGETLEGLGSHVSVPEAFSAAAGGCTESLPDLEQLWRERLDRGEYN